MMEEIILCVYRREEYSYIFNVHGVSELTGCNLRAHSRWHRWFILLPVFFPSEIPNDLFGNVDSLVFAEYGMCKGTGA